jgi:hypothetical protein
MVTAMFLKSTGNLLIGTTTDSGYKLDVNGTGRFSGTLSLTNASNSILYLKNTATNGKEWNFQSYLDGTLYIGVSGLATYPLTIASTGAATFSSSVTATNITNNGIYYGRANASFPATSLGYFALKTNNLDGERGGLTVQVSNSTSTFIDALTINYTGAATFSSTCTATGFFESSDSRLKTLIQDNYQTKGIASITPKLYTKNGKVELGYYAQDFVGILDSAVSKGSDDMLSLSYREVHTAKIYALEQEIKELKAKIN